MVRTLSTHRLPLGSAAPEFTLPDVFGHPVSLSSFKTSKAVIVMFICNHCPFVKHIRREISDLAKDYQTKGVAVVGINSNDAETHPEDSPEKMREEARRLDYTFPYLHDSTQEVAKAYGAACTPEFFVLDGDRHLVYHGQFDDSRPGNDKPVTGHDLKRAINAVLAGKPVPEPQKQSLGCNIKWKPGNEPEYFGA